MVGGGFGPVGRLGSACPGPERIGDLVAEDPGVRGKAVGAQQRGVLPQCGGRGGPGGGDASDDGQFADVDLQLPVEVRVAGLRADGLVVAEGSDDVDGRVGRLGPGEQVEAPGDEDVSDEDVEVGGVPVAGGPRVVEGQPAGEDEALVDELDAGSAAGEPVVGRAGVVAGGGGAHEGQDTRGERRVLEAVGEPVAERVGLDVLDCREGGAADRRDFLHWLEVAAGRAKTFGNPLTANCMIRTTDDDGVCTVTLDRPERRNALTREGLRDLRAAVEAATAPVVYLTGAGPAFCAGADLDVVRSLDEAAAREFADLGQDVARTLETYDGAVVAGIDGPARGGGVELALACDLRVATSDATLAETGVKLGLFGAWGGTARLPSIVGRGEAMDVMLSGRTLDADEALRMGLVSRVTEDPREVPAELASVDPTALRAIKPRIRDDADRETKERRERDAFARLVATAEP